MAQKEAESDSILYVERISQYVSLPPACLELALPALCATIFSPLLLSYFPAAKGIVLAYEDVQLSDQPPSKVQDSDAQRQPQSSHHGETLYITHVDEYAAPFLWATASFLVWRPRQDAYLTGRITHQSNTHVSLAHLNTFPISVLPEHLPAHWSWHSHETGKLKKGWDGKISDEGGWWVDDKGERISSGTEMRLRIRDFEGRTDGRGRGKGMIRIEGSLLSVEEEKAKKEKEKEKGKKVTKPQERLANGVTEAVKGQQNGEVEEETIVNGSSEAESEKGESTRSPKKKRTKEEKEERRKRKEENEGRRKRKEKEKDPERKKKKQKIENTM